MAGSQCTPGGTQDWNAEGRLEEGWVYVLVNSSMPGLVKVGRTARSAHHRAAELSGVTGIATPFIVAYEQSFADCQEAERAIHAELDRRGLRISPNREFFGGPASDIIRLVMQAGAGSGHAGAASPLPADQTAEACLAAGDRARHGLGASLQDTGEAIRCYKLAASRGAMEAWERLGAIYIQLYARKRDRAGRRRAMAPLKEGARRGNFYCYCGMADVFALEGHLANVAKAWALFFAGVTERDSPRFAQACSRYIALCLDLQVVPCHLPELRQAAEAIVAALLAELDLARGDPAARRRVSASLRWAYASVLPEPPAPHRPVRARRSVWGMAIGSLA